MDAVITMRNAAGHVYWLAQKICLSNAEAVAAKAILDRMPDSAAFLPTAAEIALADGFPATGASNATHVVEQPEAPALTPEQEAMLAATESRDADQPEDMGLNVGIHLSPDVDTGD